MPELASPPWLATRQQPPFKAPLAPPPRVQVAPVLGNDIRVKPPPATLSPQQRSTWVSGVTPTPLVPAAPEPRSIWIAPQTVEHGGWHDYGSAWTDSDTPPQGPARWGTTSAADKCHSSATHLRGALLGGRAACRVEDHHGRLASQRHA